MRIGCIGCWGGLEVSLHCDQAMNYLIREKHSTCMAVLGRNHNNNNIIISQFNLNGFLQSF